VAADYEGCTSPIVFNDADDRAAGTYDLWSYQGDVLGWVAGKVGPAVTVNQSDGPVTVQRGDEVAVAVKIDPLTEQTYILLEPRIHTRVTGPELQRLSFFQ